MSNLSEQPQKGDVVLGGVTPPPLNAPVLGGMAGIKQRLVSAIQQEKMAALEDALDHGEAGLELIVDALKGDYPDLELKPLETLIFYYYNLQRLLAKGQWEQADQKTRSLLLAMVGREDQWLRTEDIDKIHGMALLTCDRLWVKYSQGHFGFSVQTKILADQPFDRFAENVGWEVINEMGGRGPWDRVDRIYRQSTIPFDLTAPPGHLPLTFELGGGNSTLLPYTNDTESVMGFYSIDGYYNNWSSDSFFGPEMVKSFLALLSH